MKKVALFSNSGKLAEALFYSSFFELKAVVCEEGKITNDLLNFSYLRGVPILNANNRKDLIEIIIKNKFELAIMCGFGIILDDKILNKIDVYNVHPGELPKYKGRHPTFFATINGEKTINFTLHKVVTEIDSGEIIDEVTMDYYYWLNETDIKNFLFKAFKLLINKLELFLLGKVNTKINEGGNYFKPVTIKDKTLDPNLPAQHLLNIIRALSLHGGGILMYNGIEYFVERASISKYQGEFHFEGKIVLHKEKPIGIKIDEKYFIKFESIGFNKG